MLRRRCGCSPLLGARRETRSTPGRCLPLLSPSYTSWLLVRQGWRLLYSHLHTERPPGSSRNTPSPSFLRRCVNSTEEPAASDSQKPSPAARRLPKKKNNNTRPQIVVKNIDVKLSSCPVSQEDESWHSSGSRGRAGWRPVPC